VSHGIFNSDVVLKATVSQIDMPGPAEIIEVLLLIKEDSEQFIRMDNVANASTMRVNDPMPAIG
jgi:hypothetical protein